jgi:hypothetical protein
MGPVHCIILNEYESLVCLISGFRGGVNEIFALLGFYAALEVVT